VEFRGAQGLGKWLWSVADLYRKGALVQFAETARGGSFIKPKNSEEKIPIGFVSNKYFRVMVEIDDSPALSYRQKQESNFYTTCLAAGVSGRILAQTQRLGLARNFKFFTDVKFGTDEASLQLRGKTNGDRSKLARSHILCCAYWKKVVEGLVQQTHADC
jgi:hypothetical protein